MFPWLPAWLRPHAQEVSFGVTGGRGGAVLGPPVRGVLRTFSALGTEAITGSRERAPGSAHPNTLSPSPCPPPLLSGPCPHPLGLGTLLSREMLGRREMMAQDTRTDRTGDPRGGSTGGERPPSGWTGQGPESLFPPGLLPEGPRVLVPVTSVGAAERRVCGRGGLLRSLCC